MIKHTKNKVLVTGAAGFVGSYICDLLLKKGYEVIGLYHSNKEKVRHLMQKKNFYLIKGNLADFAEISRILKKVKPHGVFHTAALHSPKPINSPFPFFEANVRGTLNLLESCRLLNIKKFVYSSSMSVYGKDRKYLPVDEEHPTNPYDFYGLTKLLGEECCKLYAREYGLNIIILRYVGIYGARRDWGAITSFIKKAISNQPLKIINNISWDILAAEDIARANFNAYKKANKLRFDIINIGSGKEINIKELAKQIVKISNSKSKIEFSNDLPRSPSSHFYFNITKAKRLLNFGSYPIEKGLRGYIDELKKEINKNKYIQK